MKQITKLFVLAIAVFTLNVSFAQQGQRVKPVNAKVKPIKSVTKLTPEQRATKNADSLKVRLNLTAEQYAKVIPINTEFFKAKDALRLKLKSDTTATKDTYKSELKVLHANRNKQINALLTAEQKKTWSTWKKNHTANVKASKTQKVKIDEDDIDAVQE